MKCTVFWVVTTCCSEKYDVSEENTAFVFSVEEYAKQKTSKNQAATVLLKLFT
jgi:hypothetical protein